MVMDADARRVADLIALAARPLGTQTIAEVRAGYRASRRVLAAVAEPVAATADLLVAGVKVRSYRGFGATAGRCLLYCHGGGWVLGDLESHDPVCRRLANQAACRVVAVDYRLAPEHPFPAAIEDALAVFQGLAAAGLEIDPANVAVAGDSAGATLATVVALTARDGATPAPRTQVLFYPVTDLATEHPSYARFTAGVPLTAASMRWFGGHYLAGANPADWRVSPLRAELAGSPPAFVLTTGFDPLCDEGAAYARALDAAGVASCHLHVPGQIHGFITMGGMIRGAETALDMAACHLRQAWRA